MTEVIIIGGGPAGSTMGCFLSKAGIKNIILEGQNHPRAHVGESMFATRIYDHQPSPALDEFRKLLNREGLREKSYESEDLYSVPIGSRFHPERAAIWETNSPIQSTEKWLGPR